MGYQNKCKFICNDEYLYGTGGKVVPIYCNLSMGHKERHVYILMCLVSLEHNDR